MDFVSRSALLWYHFQPGILQQFIQMRQIEISRGGEVIPQPHLFQALGQIAANSYLIHAFPAVVANLFSISLLFHIMLKVKLLIAIT